MNSNNLNLSSVAAEVVVAGGSLGSIANDDDDDGSDLLQVNHQIKFIISTNAYIHPIYFSSCAHSSDSSFRSSVNNLFTSNGVSTASSQ